MTASPQSLRDDLPGILREEAERLAEDWGLSKRERNSHLGFVGGLIPRVMPRVTALAAPSEPPALDVDRLRRAIYAVSVRHDWEHTVDREDRTEEIAAEYAAAPPIPASAEARLQSEEPGQP